MDSGHGPIRALIADDDATSLFILEALAQSFNLETVTAMDVASAKRSLTRIVPHIAILDVMFPDGDGVDILLEIRRRRTPTAVALISATLEQFPFHKCGNTRPDFIFTKPLDTEAVGAWIEKQITQLQGCMVPSERFQIP